MTHNIRLDIECSPHLSRRQTVFDHFNKSSIPETPCTAYAMHLMSFRVYCRHDPCAVAYVIDPSIFKARDIRLDIECNSSLSRGQTVFDRWGQYTRGNPASAPCPPHKLRDANVRVCLSADTAKFWDVMFESIQRANEACSL